MKNFEVKMYKGFSIQKLPSICGVPKGFMMHKKGAMISCLFATEVQAKDYIDGDMMTFPIREFAVGGGR